MAKLCSTTDWLTGYIPDLPTPFNEAGDIDLVSLARLIARAISSGASAVVICGTAGEASTLTPAEQTAVIREAVGIAGRRIRVIAGAGSNATSQAIELAARAQSAGADAVLSVVPYYNKPTQDGIHAHFDAIGRAIELPVLLHDVPSRTARSLADDTIVRLARSGRFTGLVDGSGDVLRPLRLRPRLPAGFQMLSGDDTTSFGFLASGGDGAISEVANIASDLCRRIHTYCRQGRLQSARYLQKRLLPLASSLGQDSPASLKYALNLLGLIRPDTRLPIVPLAGDSAAHLAAVLAAMADEDLAEPLGA
ncbi:4-hydroxy-tetrahydrodipicolinate synthase [Rhodopseudomonas palustris]|uniref:4-hydroxy-tetrahydrodipicolinate synthase n=1 Tax=Rhodopseudomonas palustris TaxID=1076 RepID=UPI0022EFFBAA|nr:4-hydroxy-tetrahydrodipicolinate synthase [Rhodopseudomonas palustris]WBU28184.1 4-hydroxy-tetrahydrodipicolinate synthase [Rhodopseudomonas palustris]